MEQEQDKLCQCEDADGIRSCSCASSSDCRSIGDSNPDWTAESSSLSSFVINSAMKLRRVRIR